MERARRRKRNRPLYAKLAGRLRRGGDLRLGAGKHLLRGGVDVCNRAAALRAKLFKLIRCRANNRDHSGLHRLAGLLHEPAAGLENLEGRVEVEHAGRAQGAPLPERKPRRAGEIDVLRLFKRTVRGVARHENRRLADVGLDELLRRPFEADLLEVEADYGVRPVEKRHRLGIALREIPAHSRRLRALACKHATY